MAFFLGYPKVQFFETANGTGQPMVGGKVKTYIAGTLVPAPTYTTLADANAGINPNPNPIILDERGEAIIVIKSAIKIALFDANDVPVWTVDNIGNTLSDIIDTNGNLLLKLTQVPNAVNYVTITNASAGTAPQVAVDGTDTNIDLELQGKGTGRVSIDSDMTLTNKNITNVASIATNVITTPVTNGNLTINPNGTGRVVMDDLIYPNIPGTTGYAVTTDGTNTLRTDQKIPQNAIVQNRSAFLGYQTTAQGIPSNTSTTLIFGTTVYDTNTCFSSNTTYTAKIAGIYQINANVEFANTASGGMVIRLDMLKNNVATSRRNSSGGSNILPINIQLNTQVQLAVNDTIVINCTHSFPGTLATTFGILGTSLSISLIELS